MNFFHSCTVAKTCRDGKSILGLPDTTYAKVQAIARATDGRQLLRATEIFAEAEQTLKYSTSPRIVFETAVMKASMPHTDYDIEALLARITQLENRIAQGNFANSAAPVPTASAVSSVSAAQPIAQAQQKYDERTAEEQSVDEPPMDIPPMDIPPDEAETGGNVYFDAPPPRREKPKATTSFVATAAAEPTAPVAPAPSVKPVRPVQKGDAKSTFGAFLRCLRKTGKSGVLFTICMDLDSEYDGETFVLQTTSDTIYRSLSKPEHADLINKAFEELGLEAGAYEIRLKGKQADGFNKSVAEIKETFGGVKVEIK